MAILEWDESIALHIPEIDEQHQKLIGWINALGDAVAKGEGASVVRDVLWDLIAYATEHFTAEERLMISWDFPGYTSHRQEHDHFVMRLQEIQSQFHDGDVLSTTTLTFMVDWLVCHIKGTDQLYGEFIRKGAQRR